MIEFDTRNLCEGDRVQLKISDTGAVEDFAFVYGTYLCIDGNGTAIIALDEEYHSYLYDSSCAYDMPVKNNMILNLAKKHNIKNINDNIYWTIDEKCSGETKIMKIIRKKDKKKMPTDSNGNEISFAEVFLKDSGKAAIRSGATLGIDGLKVGITKMLSSQGFDGPAVKSVMKFFDTALGDALIRGGLGYGLLGLPIPYIQENEYAQQLSEELRVSGLSGGMDQGVAMMKMFIVPALMEAFKDTPIMQGIKQADKARVAEHVAPQRIAAPAVTHEHEDFEIAEDPFKAPMQASL
jgi:hypothetical protein